MSDSKDWTDHVLDGQTWLRFLFMLLFTPLLGCIGFMVLCLALFQFFSVLASGESNPQLRDLGRDLNRLGVDIVAFLTFNTDCKPFPFKSCSPDSQGAETAVEPGKDGKTVVTETSRENTPRSGLTSTRRKTVSRKKASTRKKTSSRSSD